MASVAGSTTDIEPDDRLRDWLTAYINKLEGIDKQDLDFFEAIERRFECLAIIPCRAKIPDEMSREYGDLRSVLREVEVDKVWMILMSVTESQSSVDMLGRIRKRRDALYESIYEGHGDVAGTIIEYLTPDQILQFLQMEDDEGEKYLYSLRLHMPPLRSSLLDKILYRLPEVSQRYEVLSIRDMSGHNVLHYRADKEILHSLESQDLCFQLLSTQDNKGQTPLFTLLRSDLETALDSVTVEQRLTLINIRDNEGQTAAEYLVRQISEEQSDMWRSLARVRLAVIEYYRREARIQIVMSTHDDDGECDDSIT